MKISIFLKNGMEEKKREEKQREGKEEKRRVGRGGERRHQSIIACSKVKYYLMNLSVLISCNVK